MTPESRLEAIENRLAVEDLVVRYCRSADDGDHDAFLALWTDEAVWAPGGPLGRHEGIGAISKGWGLMASLAESMHHLPCNHLMRLSRDEGDGSNDAIAILRLRGLAPFQLVVRYHDRYRRTPNGWRFVAREAVAFDPPLEEILSGA